MRAWARALIKSGWSTCTRSLLSTYRRVNVCAVYHSLLLFCLGREFQHSFHSSRGDLFSGAFHCLRKHLVPSFPFVLSPMKSAVADMHGEAYLSAALAYMRYWIGRAR